MIVLLCLLLIQVFSIESTEVQPRVLKGQLAKEGQFPYLVQLKVHHTIFHWTWCGGNIISNEWILTAAHCFDKFHIVAIGYIYYGSTVHEQGSGISFIYNHVVKHPLYSPNINDLALIKTPWVRFSNLIKSIPLPSPMDTSQYQLALTAGWNPSVDGKQDNLMWTTVQIARCYSKYLNNGELLCGRVKKGSSMCKGDSGGPLVDSQNRTLIGVSSFVENPGPCDNGKLVSFVNVVNYLDWIRDVSGVTPAV